MKRTLTRITAGILISTISVSCAPVRNDGPSVEHGLSTAAVGMGHLMLSPFLIVAGLLEGIAALPYFLSYELHELNREMVKANAAITLDDTYESAYGRQLESVPSSGSTGVVFTHMRDATSHFRQLLRQYGVHNAERYLLTAVRTADRDGYTLYAVIYRPAESIDVVDRYDGRYARTLSREDDAYYQPYARDAQGRPLDRVVDWAGVSRETIKTQKGQAILMTLAANSILNNKHTPDYWAVEERWVAGEFRQISEQRTDQLRRRMGLEPEGQPSGRSGAPAGADRASPGAYGYPEERRYSARYTRY